MKTMRTFVLILAGFAINLSASNASNHSSTVKTQSKDEKTYTFKVDGSCDMCKSKIEKAAKDVKGVSSAKWDAKTHILTVKAKPEVNITDVHNAIAKVGYDTDKVKADAKVYNSLPKCCQYRK